MRRLSLSQNMSISPLKKNVLYFQKCACWHCQSWTPLHITAPISAAKYFCTHLEYFHSKTKFVTNINFIYHSCSAWVIKRVQMYNVCVNVYKERQHWVSISVCGAAASPVITLLSLIWTGTALKDDHNIGKSHGKQVHKQHITVKWAKCYS